MQGIAITAHYDGNHIQLDEPFPLTPQSRIIVTVLPETESFEAWRADWFRFAAQNLAHAYGENEPEYSEADLIKE